jgi:hypothetical protein
VQRAIDLRPSLVRLWPSEGGPGGASALVRVAHAGRGTFEITGLEVADPKLVSATLESAGSQAIHSLRVSLAEGVTAADVGRRTTVRIATSDPLRPLVELPVELVAQHLAARRSVRRQPRPTWRATRRRAAGDGAGWQVAHLEAISRRAPPGSPTLPRARKEAPGTCLIRPAARAWPR